MTNLRLKVPYILLQGIFLPLLWMLDTFYDNGQAIQAWLVFVAYELLVLVDAILFWVIFDRR